MTATLQKLRKPGEPKREKADALEFTSGIAGQPLRVDREKGIIYGVKIIGNDSRNNRTYPQTVLSKAKALYEGRSVNISHPKRENAADDRPFDSLFGRLENVQEDNGLRGDLPYIKAHPLAEMVCEAAERFPENFGLSHNAHVDWLVKDDGHRVCESVNQVRTVDLVCRPATTSGIFESEQYMDPTLDPAGGNGAPAATAPEVVEDGDPHCKMLLEGVKKIYDGEGDAGDKVKRIAALAKAVLKTQDDVDQAINGGKGAPEDDDEEEDEDAEESVKEKRRQQKTELATAQQRLAGYEKQEKARNALESAKVEVTTARIKAVAALESVEDQKALIDEFKSAKPADPKPKPKSLPATALESEAERKPGDALPTGLKPRSKEDLKNLASSLQRR